MPFGRATLGETPKQTAFLGPLESGVDSDRSQDHCSKRSQVKTSTGVTKHQLAEIITTILKGFGVIFLPPFQPNVKACPPKPNLLESNRHLSTDSGAKAQAKRTPCIQPRYLGSPPQKAEKAIDKPRPPLLETEDHGKPRVLSDSIDPLHSDKPTVNSVTEPSVESAEGDTDAKAIGLDGGLHPITQDEELETAITGEVTHPELKAQDMPDVLDPWMSRESEFSEKYKDMVTPGSYFFKPHELLDGKDGPYTVFLDLMSDRKIDELARSDRGEFFLLNKAAREAMDRFDQKVADEKWGLDYQPELPT